MDNWYQLNIELTRLNAFLDDCPDDDIEKYRSLQEEIDMVRAEIKQLDSST